MTCGTCLGFKTISSWKWDDTISGWTKVPCPDCQSDRVTELLEANNREVAARREAECKLLNLQREFDAMLKLLTEVQHQNEDLRAQAEAQQFYIEDWVRVADERQKKLVVYDAENHDLKESLDQWVDIADEALAEVERLAAEKQELSMLLGDLLGGNLEITVTWDVQEGKDSAQASPSRECCASQSQGCSIS